MLIRLAALLALSAPSLASHVTYTNQLPYQPVIGPSGAHNSYTVNVPQFDPQLGRLTQVYVLARLDVQGAVSIENLDTSTSPSGFYVGAGGSATFCNHTPYAYFDYEFSAGQLGPYDGTIDYAGPSGAVTTFPQPVFIGPIAAGAWSNDPGFPIPGQPLGSTAPSLLDLATGMGVLPIVIDAFPNIQPQWNTTHTNWSFTMDASPRVEITYYYDNYPARFCTGDVLGACPCAATSGPTGGCPNSVNPNGANLVWTGSSSVGADTFTLTASGMPLTTTVLFFQGTSAPNLGALFGDGKRCVGGVLTRLGSKQSVNGSSTHPGPGDLPISVKGAVPAGSLRAYQAWYRNSDPVFCTAATFNLTSAVATVWTP